MSIKKANGNVMTIETKKFNIFLLRNVNLLELISTVEFILKLFLEFIAQGAKVMAVERNFR